MTESQMQKAGITAVWTVNYCSFAASRWARRNTRVWELADGRWYWPDSGRAYADRVQLLWSLTGRDQPTEQPAFRQVSAEDLAQDKWPIAPDVDVWEIQRARFAPEYPRDGAERFHGRRS